MWYNGIAETMERGGSMHNDKGTIYQIVLGTIETIAKGKTSLFCIAMNCHVNCLKEN